MLEVYGGYAAQSNHNSMTELLQRGSFDGFSIYELDKEGKPFRYSSADAFFERDVSFVIYDLVTVGELGLISGEPDNLAENAQCYNMTRATKSELLTDVLGKIIYFRLNHPNH